MSALQTTFNKVIEHLARQRVAAIDKSGNCLLRGPDNTKCAVGFFIPDNIYTKAMEEDSAISNMRMQACHTAPVERHALVRSYYPMHAVLDDFLDPSTEYRAAEPAASPAGGARHRGGARPRTTIQRRGPRDAGQPAVGGAPHRRRRAVRP